MAVLRVSKGHLVLPALKGLVSGSAGMVGPSPTPMGSDTPWSIPGPTTHQRGADSGGIQMLREITTILTDYTFRTNARIGYVKYRMSS